MKSSTIIALGESILQGHEITAAEALSLTRAENSDIPLLCAYANKIRAQYAGNTVDMCGIINARSGMCSEDCKFCAQSVHHQTNTPVYPLLPLEEIIVAAKKAEQQGAKRASIVTSGKGMDTDPQFHEIVTAIRAIHTETRLTICANLGTITAGQAKELAEAGVKRYAHNLETSKRFYPEVCTTHPFSERVETVAAAKAAGMELCTGGIIGLGETWEDRVDLAFALREIGVQSVPLNILNPIAGTALAGNIPPSPLDSLKTFAIFRFILPRAVLRPAGGREINLRDMQGALLLAGANGLIIGNYLTFTGRDTQADFQMVADAGLVPS